MPIVGSRTPPAFPPPAGTQWVLQRNVLVWDGSGQAPSNMPPDAGDTVIYTFTGNYGHPDQTDPDGYSLAYLHFLRVDVYLDAALFETMAVDWAPTGESPNNPAEAVYVKIDGGDVEHFTNLSVGAGFAWPRDFAVEYTATIDAPPGVMVGVWPYSITGDVWVALPASSRLPQINPTNPTLDPEQSGLELTWSRRNARVPRAPHALGEVAALTWPPMWDGAKRFLLDGHHLQVDALPAGGYTVQGDWYFIRIPGDPDVTVSPPPSETGIVHAARTDIDSTDDPLALTT